MGDPWDDLAAELGGGTATAPNEWDALAAELQGPPAPQGNVGTAFVRGLGESLGAGMSWTARMAREHPGLVPGGNPVGRLLVGGLAKRALETEGVLGSKLASAAQTLPAPHGFAQELAGAAGGVAPYLAMGALPGGQVPAIGGMMGQHVTAGYDDVLRATGDENKAILAAVLNIPGAAAMAVPFGRLFGKLGKPLQGIIGRAIDGGVTGTLGLGSAQVLGDFVHEQLTDEDRDILGNLAHGARTNAVLFTFLGAAAGLHHEAKAETRIGKAREAVRGIVPKEPEPQPPAIEQKPIKLPKPAQESAERLFKSLDATEQGDGERSPYRVVEPPMPEHAEAAKIAGEFGLEARFFSKESGEQAPRPGAFHEGRIYLDANAPPDSSARAVLLHEIAHSAPDELYQRISEKDPQGLEAAKQEYSAAHEALGGEPLSEAEAKSEAVSYWVERNFRGIESERAQPGKLAEFLTGDPGLAEKLLDSLTNIARKVPGMRGVGALSREAKLEALRGEIKPYHDLSPEDALAVSRAVLDVLRTAPKAIADESRLLPARGETAIPLPESASRERVEAAGREIARPRTGGPLQLPQLSESTRGLPAESETSREQRLSEQEQARPETEFGAPKFALPRKPDELGFYSALERAAEDKLSARASPDQILRTLTNAPGVKGEEIEASGLKDFLKGKLSVTKEEVLDHLAERGVRVEQKMLGGERSLPATERMFQLEAKPYAELTASERAELSDIYEGKYGPGAPTKHGQWQLPGGENYRELLLSVPEKSATREAVANRALELMRNGGVVPETADASVHEAYMRAAEGELMPRGFTGGHYGDIAPNVVAHARTTDRSLTTGEDISFAEEIQSDLHQKAYQAAKTEAAKEGLKKGTPEFTKRVGELTPKQYRGAGRSVAEIDREMDALHSTDYQSSNRETRAAAAARLDALQSERNRAQHGLPDLPFKKSWPSLTLKRLISDAVKRGKEGLGWTTGAQQVDRYNEAMRQNVDRIEVEPRTKFDRLTGLRVSEHKPTGDYGVERLGADGNWEFVDFAATHEAAFKKMHALASTSDNQHVYVKAFKEGQERFGAEVPLEGTTTIHGHEVALEDVVGKDIADKIRSKPSEAQKFEGEGLAIGGAGMQGFYDKILVDEANRLGKKYGAQVRDAAVETGESSKNISQEALRAEAERQINEGDIGAAYLLRNVARGREVVDTATALRNLESEPEHIKQRFGVTPESFRIAKAFILDQSASQTKQIHYLPIPPAMRASVEGEGQPRFALPASATRAARSGFDIPEERWHDRLYSGLANAYESINRAEKAAPNKLKGESVAEALSLWPGREFSEGQRFEREFEKPIRTKLAEAGKAGIAYEDIKQFLMAAHAADRDAVIAARGGPANGSGMDPAKAASILKAADSGPHKAFYEGLREWNRRLNKFRLDTLERGGLLDSGARAEWEKFGPDYVPLRTIQDDPAYKNDLGGKGLVVSGKESQRAEGRATEADDPLAFAVQTAMAAIRRAARNRPANAVAEMVKINPKGPWRIETDLNKVRPNEQTLPFKDAGEQKYVVTSHTPLAEAFRQMDTAEAGPLTVMDPLLRFMHSAITRWDPTFSIRNMVRDIGTGSLRHFIEGNPRAALATMRSAVPAARGAFQAMRTEGSGGYWGDVYRKAREAGALVGWNENMDIHKRIKSLEGAMTPQRKATAFFEMMGDVNNAAELGTRLVTFDALTKQGVPETQAAVRTRRITADFARRGKWAPVYRRLYLFSGANIQGLTEFGSVVRKNPRRASAVAGALLGIGMAQYLASRMFGDENELDKLSEDEKARYFGLMVGKKRVGFPAPYTYNAITYTGYKLGEVLFGDEKPADAVAGVIGQSAESLSPLPAAPNPLMAAVPTVARPLAEIGVNEDFAGRPIARPQDPFDRNPTPRSQTPFRGTSPAYVAMADALHSLTGGTKVKPGRVEVAPEQIRHLARAAVPGVGTLVDRAVEGAIKMATGDPDLSASDIPILGQVMRPFVRDIPKGAESQLFYENIGKIELAAKQRKVGESPDEPALLRLKASADFTQKRLKNLREAAEKNPSRERELRKQMDEIMQTFNQRARLARGRREVVVK